MCHKRVCLCVPYHSAGSIGYGAGGNNTCSGDDWACWPRSQVNLLHTLANVSGCTVVLTGDYHYSDLKVIEPGTDAGYSAPLQTARLGKPVYQVGVCASMFWQWEGPRQCFRLAGSGG